MSHNPKEAEKEMEKAIFISGDCWLSVFDLLPRSQLGLGIAMISHRFDRRVDEHFKTRKWKLDFIRIKCKIGENGAKEMEIVNYGKASLPIPQNPLPNKVIGFGTIKISFIDQNVLTFLRRFHRFFDKCVTDLWIITKNVRISEFFALNIWPMLKDTIIHWMQFPSIAFRRMRQLAPSLLNDCPNLCFRGTGTILPEFPPDDSANASDGQAVTKWLFSARPDNFRKVLSVTIGNSALEQWLSTLEQIKAAFSSASSPVNFIILVGFPLSSSLSAIVPFKLTNELTGEELALSKEDANHFKLIRCPIAHDEREWWKTNVELFYAIGRNQIKLYIGDGAVDDGVLDDSPGPSGDH